VGRVDSRLSLGSLKRRDGSHTFVLLGAFPPRWNDYNYIDPSCRDDGQVVALEKQHKRECKRLIVQIKYLKEGVHDRERTWVPEALHPRVTPLIRVLVSPPSFLGYECFTHPLTFVVGRIAQGNEDSRGDSPNWL